MSVIPAKQRKIKKVAVLGSGIMGSRIACHFANIGIQVVLLDIVPFDLKDEEKNKPAARNKIVNLALKNTLKSRPSSLYHKSYVQRIVTGNFDDNMNLIADCDWVIEAVIERLDIKKQVFENVEKHRKPGTIISSNTSGIPIEMMLDGRSDDFKTHFVGTHFFNPPRYLRLLEIIPTSKTSQEVTDFLMHYGDLFLGKTTVLCKDTPAFIANRIGVFSILSIFHLMEEMELSVEEIDALTGPLTGKPKSATFRTCDVVGLDTLVKVADGVYQNCPDDEARKLFEIPTYVTKMVENNMLGDKTKQGFYKKSKTPEGKRSIQALNVSSFEYAAKQRPNFPIIAMAKPIDDLKKRLVTIHKGQDKGADFLRKQHYNTFQYVSNRIPEISDEVYRLDDAMRTGFGWELGPFEHWDVLGVANVVSEMKEAGFQPAAWVEEMVANGVESFYRVENGARQYYDVAAKAYKTIPGRDAFIFLDNLRSNKPVFANSDTTLHDIGDGVLCLEFHTKMNAMGAGVAEGINKAIDLAEKDYVGLVIGNEAPNFSAGANLATMLMTAVEQEWDELNMMISQFQKTMGRARFSSVPVVVAPRGMALGGGCELSLHADSIVASAETYIGLVEVGAGLIPGGGGTKEFALRASDSFTPGDTQLPTLFDKFQSIATAKVATSAQEAFEMGIMRTGIDEIVVNQDRVILEAKRKVLQLHEEGYTQPAERQDVLVLGRTGLAALYAGAAAFNIGGYASKHDMLIAQKLAYVICGGDLSAPTKVSEQYLLDLEREAFLSLLGEQKTLERIQSILQKGRPLRN